MFIRCTSTQETSVSSFHDGPPKLLSTAFNCTPLIKQRAKQSGLSFRGNWGGEGLEKPKKTNESAVYEWVFNDTVFSFEICCNKISTLLI